MSAAPKTKAMPIPVVWLGPPTGRAFVSIETNLKTHGVDIIRHVDVVHPEGRLKTQGARAILVYAEWMRGPAWKAAKELVRNAGLPMVPCSSNAALTVQRLAEAGVRPIEAVVPSVRAAVGREEVLRVPLFEVARIKKPEPEPAPVPEQRHIGASTYVGTLSELGLRMRMHLLEALETGPCTERDLRKHIIDVVPEKRGHEEKAVQGQVLEALAWLERAGFVQRDGKVRLISGTRGRHGNRWKLTDKRHSREDVIAYAEACKADRTAKQAEAARARPPVAPSLSSEEDVEDWLDSLPEPVIVKAAPAAIARVERQPQPDWKPPFIPKGRRWHTQRSYAEGLAAYLAPRGWLE